MKNQEEPEDVLQLIMNSIHDGVQKAETISKLIQKDISSEKSEELYDIAKARIKGKEKFADADLLWMTCQDLRFATPDIVADYRAKRLACSTIIDACSGIGSQALAFAKTCKHVYAIEIDERKNAFAIRNAKTRGITNITFICGDAASSSVISKIPKADMVFLDPSRPSSENERSIESISIISMILKNYSHLTKCFAIEVPPQILPEKIPFDCECEYLSIDNRLNRLTLYLKGQKRKTVSVVALPSGEKLQEGKKKELEENKLEHFLYDCDTAVIKAGLIKELVALIKEPIYLYRKSVKSVLLTSNEHIISPFLICFEVLASTRNNAKDIILSLNRNHVGQVILRGEIPEKEYGEMRRKFEIGISGSHIGHLFIFGNDAVICRKMQ